MRGRNIRVGGRYFATSDYYGIEDVPVLIRRIRKEEFCPVYAVREDGELCTGGVPLFLFKLTELRPAPATEKLVTSMCLANMRR